MRCATAIAANGNRFSYQKRLERCKERDDRRDQKVHGIVERPHERREPKQREGATHRMHREGDNQWTAEPTKTDRQMPSVRKDLRALHRIAHEERGSKRRRERPP